MEILGVRSIYVKKVLSHKINQVGTTTKITLLVLTLLSGVPLMCVVTFSGKCRNPVVELGIDPFAEI